MHFFLKVWKNAEALQEEFAATDKTVAANTRKVLSAFTAARVGAHHFVGSTGFAVAFFLEPYFYLKYSKIPKRFSKKILGLFRYGSFTGVRPP